MEEEKLKQENERLKAIIKQLREQLDRYRRGNKKTHEYDRDYVPYHEEDR